jgi:hypothetical protein
MATKTVTLSIAAYTKLDTTSASAIDMQNTSLVNVRVILDSSLPGVGDDNFYLVKPGQGLSRDGKAGDMYALPMGNNGKHGLAPTVTVGE